MFLNVYFRKRGKKRPKENHGKTEIKSSKIKNEVNGFLKKCMGTLETLRSWQSISKFD